MKVHLFRILACVAAAVGMVSCVDIPGAFGGGMGGHPGGMGGFSGGHPAPAPAFCRNNCSTAFHRDMPCGCYYGHLKRGCACNYSKVNSGGSGNPFDPRKRVCACVYANTTTAKSKYGIAWDCSCSYRRPGQDCYCNQTRLGGTHRH